MGAAAGGSGVGVAVRRQLQQRRRAAVRGTETAAIEAVDIATGEPAWITEEGFDPATGAATWTVLLVAASALSDDTKPLVRLGPTAFTLVRDDGSRIAVDVAAGEELGATGDGRFAWVDAQGLHVAREAP